MYRRPIAIFLLLAVSCKTRPTGSQTLDFGVFKLRTTIGWTKFKKQGVDSYFGGLASGKDTLWFDYGLYGVDLTGEDSIAHRFAKDTVNGYPANIMIPDTAGKGYISMSISKVAGKNKFTIWGLNIKETDAILKIYKSIVFKNSDTLQNPPLTSSKFIYTSKGTGRSIFYSHCANCHAIHKIIVGPALEDLIPKRSNEWVYDFLTDRKKVQNDSAYKALSSKYEFHCIEFPGLAKDDLNLVLDYIKNEL